ncbi:hypothetical protein FOZ60_015098 [Perkinsus olseni]|uniref:Sugar phosphate transporter domain-containing protein n=1 Tax=Perkinsus olseni TaxID=32597 RepID=A0A7J6P7D0_PEROL|nr:hypothetical protein FOZ60_015098 [Perkinsus olseni]
MAGSTESMDSSSSSSLSTKPATKQVSALKRFSTKVADRIEHVAFWPLMIVFVASAIMQNLCEDQIRNHGGGGKKTVHLLTFAANALGNVLVVLLPAAKPLWKCDWKRAAIPSAVDIVSQVLLQFGIVLAGAQIYTMLYNSCIVWTVVLSFIFLKQRFSIWQIAAIVIVIGGVAMKSFVNSVDGSHQLVVGTILILCGCFMHSLTNIINEYYIKKYDFPPTRLCGLIGIYSIIVYTFYFIGWNSWRVQEQIVDEIDEAGSDVGTVMGWYILFILCNFLHAACFFLLLNRIGNVGTAIAKGLKTGIYIFLSHFMYCSHIEKYCLFPLDRWQRDITLASALMSIFGVVAYGYATKKYNEKKARKAAEASKAQQPEDN